MGSGEAPASDCAVAGEFLAAGVNDETPYAGADAAKETAGQRVVSNVAFGRYQLEETIGVGGMGMVYRAYDPMLERHVALKIVRPAQTGEEVQRRLFREAQLLAQVRHPNVVSVHDVGILGRDVFVAMEFAEDTVPLSEWQRGRDRDEVLRAYLEAGKGLAAAHRRGLIHRDVKPENILIDREGRVTVIDFGLATVVEAGGLTTTTTDPGNTTQTTPASLSEKLTQAGSVIGTPRYMSPEQHDSENQVDARSDQYNLAVAIYDAVCGVWPFGDEGPFSTIRDLYVAKLKAPFASPARKVPRRLLAVLERALSPVADERFPTMDAFLRALQRALEARQRLVTYSLGIGVCLALGGVAAGLTAGQNTALCRGGKSEIAAIWNDDSKAKIRSGFLATGRSYADDTFERVAGSLDQWSSKWAGTHRDVCEATHVRGVQSEKVLDLRMGCLERKRRSLEALVGVLADNPDVQVVDKAIAASFELGDLAFCSDVEALEQEVAPPERPEDRRTLAALQGRLEKAKQLHKLGKYREANAVLDDIEPRVEALGFAPLQVRFSLYAGAVARRLGDYARAESLLNDALDGALQRRLLRLAVMAAGEAAVVVGYGLHRHAEGLLLARQGLSLARGSNMLEARMLDAMAVVYWDKEDYVEAERVQLRALETSQQGPGRDSLGVTRSLQTLAILYWEQEKYSKAMDANERALALGEEHLGRDHPEVAALVNNLANLQWSLGNYADAEKLYRRALESFEKALGSEHPNVAQALYNLALAHYHQDDFVEAARLNKRALAIRETLLAPEDLAVAKSLNNLASSYQELERYAEAEELYQRALLIFEATLAPDHAATMSCVVGLAQTYERRGRFAEALQLFQRAERGHDKNEAAASARAEVAFGLARVHWALGKDRARARALARKALSLYESATDQEAEVDAVKRWTKRHP